MSPLSIEEALEHVDPSLPNDDAKRASAQRIVEGVAANEAYWDSRPELEALRARVEGHGVVQRGSDTDPTDAVGPTDTAGAIDSTATEETSPALDAPAADAAAAPPPSPDNPNQAIATLRAQLAQAGLTPEA